jgi:adenylate kinase family enzyme
MQRVLVIGHCGAGKSTLAATLGSILKLPVIYLDQHFWKPGWVETERMAWREKVRELVSSERWIIDGNYDGTLDIRLPRADTVIFLDFSTRVCLWRVAKRMISGYGKTRYDLASGCPEKVDWEFIVYTWRFRRDIRPRVYAALKEHYRDGRLIVLATPAEVAGFVASLEGERPQSG